MKTEFEKAEVEIIRFEEKDDIVTQSADYDNGADDGSDDV